MPTAPVWIDYTNWRGARRWRHIMPYNFVFKAVPPYHPEPQWMFEAVDIDEGYQGFIKYFICVNIHEWRTEQQGPGETRG